MKDGFSLVLSGQSRIARDVRQSGSEGFSATLDFLRAADLAFTNFENTILGRHGGFPVKTGYRVPPGADVLDALAWTGFRALSLANNHAFDLGPPGILSTLEDVAARGFLHAGTGADAGSAARPGFLDTVAGRIALVAMDASPQPDFFYAADARDGNPARPGINRLEVAQSLVLGGADYDSLLSISETSGNELRKARKAAVGFGKASAGHSAVGSEAFDFCGLLVERGEGTKEARTIVAADRERQLAAIRAAAASSDFVIAYLHHHLWEADWEAVPGWTQAFARDCIDAGANAFVSHGVPVLQGLEIYRGQPLFYSLGNFIFHSHRAATRTDDRIWTSVVAKCRFDGRGRLDTAEFLPIVLGGERALGDRELPREVPEAVGGAMAEGIIARFAALSGAFGSNIALDGGKGRLVL